MTSHPPQFTSHRSPLLKTVDLRSTSVSVVFLSCAAVGRAALAYQFGHCTDARRNGEEDGKYLLKFLLFTIEQKKGVKKSFQTLLRQVFLFLKGGSLSQINSALTSINQRVFFS